MKKQSKHTTENQKFANLGRFQSIDVEHDWGRVKERIGFQKSRRMTTIWQVAAIAILVLSVGFLTKQYVINQPATILTVAGDEQNELLLPDGTQVFLNKNTSLAYPEKFKRNRRQVRLIGEGFFEVTPNPSKPFLVNVADRATVEVLGTSFNISAPRESSLLRVQVLEGKVAFYANGEFRMLSKVLVKDDQAQLLNGVISMNPVKDMNFLSWKTGVIYFEQEEINDVAEILSIHYNKAVILDNSVDRHLTFTSIIDNQDLKSVLEELSIVLEIEYTSEDDVIVLHNHD